jgi:hypothetical protein
MPARSRLTRSPAKSSTRSAPAKRAPTCARFSSANPIRRDLNRAVREARTVAEKGARSALVQLGVEDARKPEGLTAAEIDLRNRLRAHARALGDRKEADDSIKASRLVREIAYEHWHRMLFARFLAANGLLIDPDHKVPVSLADLEQLAGDEDRDWIDLAAEWASPMLP